MEKRVPFIAMFDITHRCNLDCVHCYVRSDGEDYKNKELDLEEICDMLQQVSKAGVIHLRLTGGEPLLRPDFKEIYLYAKKKNLAVTILTNATLITEDMVNFFEKHPPSMLAISSYDLTAQTYEEITRVKGSFKCFQKAIRLLKKTRIRYIVKSVIMKTNYKEAKDMERIAGAIEAYSFYSYYLVPRRDGDIAKNMLINQQRLAPEEIKTLFNSNRKAKAFKVDGSSRKDRIEECGAGRIGFYIDPYGKFNICAFINGPNIDLKKVRFIDAWKSYKMDRTPLMKKKIACGDCESSFSCMWCPGLAYLETGSTEKSIPYLCRITDAVNKERETQKCSVLN